MSERKLTQRAKAVLATVYMAPITVTINAPGIESTTPGETVTRLVVRGGKFDVADKMRALADVIAGTEDAREVVGASIVVLLQRAKPPSPTTTGTTGKDE